MWLKVVAVIIIILTIVSVWGSLRWKFDRDKLQKDLLAAKRTIEPAIYNSRELDGLPTPVQKYFRKVLKEGQPIISKVKISHEGEFNLGEGEAKWSPFTSRQLVVTRQSGFDWEACISIFPLIKIFVRDAYCNGEGILQASLWGLFTLANLQGGLEIAAGELMRFLAEAVWYPTALLPSQGVHWRGIDDRSANATIQDGKIAVSLDFHFNSDGSIDRVNSSARYRTIKDKLIPTPWQGRFWDYRDERGISIPAAGEVSWQLDTGLSPYWRGRIVRVDYEVH